MQENKNKIPSELDQNPDDNFYLKFRKNFVDILLSKIIKNKRKMKILDIGSNTGVNVPILKKYGEVYATDLNKEPLVFAKNRGAKEIKVMDATNLEYPKENFDLICVFDVLEHIPGHKLAVKNIKKVLKKKGHCIVTVPAFKFLFSSHDRALKHQRRYNFKQLFSLFKEFKLIEKGYTNFLFFLPIALMRIVKRNKDTGKEDPFVFKGPLNKILFQILDFENSLIKSGFRFPFGLTLYAIFQKQ